FRAVSAVSKPSGVSWFSSRCAVTRGRSSCRPRQLIRSARGGATRSLNIYGRALALDGTVFAPADDHGRRVAPPRGGDHEHTSHATGADTIEAASSNLVDGSATWRGRSRRSGADA